MNDGQVIHVDFGEFANHLVPFRLSRHLMDGMGFLKERGLFKETCVAVLSELFRDQSFIPSILELCDDFVIGRTYRPFPVLFPGFDGSRECVETVVDFPIRRALGLETAPSETVCGPYV